MARVLGFDPKVMKQCTCSDCGAINEYSPKEVAYLMNTSQQKVTDEGVPLLGIRCGHCCKFVRTNH